MNKIKSTKSECTNNDGNNDKHKGDDETSMMDSPWSWVVLAVCMLGTTAMGSSYVLFGLIYQDLIEEFQSNSATVGWVGSLYIGCANLTGLVCGLVVERVGCRIVCFLGSLLCTAGFFLSFFATSVIYLYVTYGIMAGTGMCMMVTACNVNVMRFFEKKRPLAGALNSLGYSIGSIFVGPVMRYLFEIFSWRGSLVIFSCLTLQMAAASTFAFGPPVIFNKSKHKYRFDSTSNKCDKNNQEIKLMALNEEKNSLQNISFHDDRFDKTCTDFISVIKTKSSSNISRMPEKNTIIVDLPFINNKLKSVDHNLPLKNNFLNENQIAIDHEFESNVKNENSIPVEVFQKETFRQILTDPTVVCFLLSCLFMYIGVQVYVYHFPSRAYILGVDRILINYLPITYNAVSFFMKFVNGFIANRPEVNRLLLFSVAVLGLGMAQLSIPLFNTFPLMMLHGSLCGIFTGIIFSLFLTVMVDLKGLPNVTKSTPMINFCFGVAGLFGTPFAGFIFDFTKNYNVTFIVTSSFVIVGSAWSFLSVCLNAKKKRKRGFK